MRQQILADHEVVAQRLLRLMVKDKNPHIAALATNTGLASLERVTTKAQDFADPSPAGQQNPP